MWPRTYRNSTLAMWVTLRMSIPHPLNDLASRRAFVNVANEIDIFMRVKGEATAFTKWSSDCRLRRRRSNSGFIRRLQARGTARSARERRPSED